MKKAGVLDTAPEAEERATLRPEQIPGEGEQQKTPTPFKKPLSHLTENWMPDKLTHAKSLPSA